MTVLRAAAETHTGYVRSTNQDMALVSGDLVAVADGMGGHLGGEVAARTAVEELLAEWRRDRTAAGLVTAVRRANRAIWRKSRSERKLHGMGTTLTAAALVEPGDGASGRPIHLALVNVGDSRAYELDTEHRLHRLTEDHSVVEEMVRQGELTPEEAAVHPHRHVLTRALGIDVEVDLDVWDLEPSPGTRIVLCSDGLTNEVPEAEIAEVLTSLAQPAEAARELVGRALGHGGVDNVTVIVIDVLESAADEPEAPIEMVPAWPTGTDPGPAEGRDITEAIPITPSASGAGSGRRTGADTGAGTGADTGAGTGAGSGPGAGAGTAGSAGPAGARRAGDLEATAAMGALAAAAMDAEQAGGRPVPTAPERTTAGVEPTKVGGIGTVGAVGAATESLSATPAADPGAADQVARARGERRPGRSMTVRARPMAPAVDGVARVPARAGTGRGGREPATTTGHHPPVVLVPRGRFRSASRDRIVTFRVALFVLLVVAVFAGTAGTVVWFNQSSYFVGLDGRRVAIYQGRPKGILWFKPQLLEDSRVTTKALPPFVVSELRTGIAESSLSASRHLISYLARVKRPPTGAPGTTTLPVTSTTSTTSTTTQPGAGAAPSTTQPAATTTLPAATTTQPATTTTQGG